MKHNIRIISLAAASLFSLVSCRSVPDATTSSWAATTLEIAGSQGAQFAGYYVVGDRKIPISGFIPKTIVDFGISGCEFRKNNPQDTLWLGARDGSSTLNIHAPPGTVGVRADFSGGWRAKLINK
jgi:hypothetical protein